MRGLGLLLLVVAAGVAHAQDVPGIEICTAEKDMVRRTSCLQSNINFLQTSIARDAATARRNLDAANRQIEDLKRSVVELQKTVSELQNAAKAEPQKVPK